MAKTDELFSMLRVDADEKHEDYALTDEEERDYYSGEGIIKFFVIQNSPKHDLFEIELIDYTGCAQWLEECLGIEYWLTDIDGDIYRWKEGVTYTILDLTSHYTPATQNANAYYGWDDADEEWEYSEIRSQWNIFDRALHKIKMLWWREITTRFSR